MNLWHEHNGGFEGVHAHELGGAVVEHEHAGIAVVVHGHRYKHQPPARPQAETVTLEVHSTRHRAHSKIGGR